MLLGRGFMPSSSGRAWAATVPVVDASRSLADVVPLVSRGRAALVTDRGALAGLLTSEDVAHAAELAAAEPPRHRWSA